MIAILIIGIILIVISFRLPTGIAMAILLAYMIPATIAIYSLNNPGPSTDSSEVQHASQISPSEPHSVGKE